MTLTTSTPARSDVRADAARQNRTDLLVLATLVTLVVLCLAVASSGQIVLALLLGAFLTSAWLLVRHLQS